MLLSGTVRPHVKKPGVTYRKVGGHMKQKQVIPAAAAKERERQKEKKRRGRGRERKDIEEGEKVLT